MKKFIFLFFSVLIVLFLVQVVSTGKISIIQKAYAGNLYCGSSQCTTADNYTECINGQITGYNCMPNSTLCGSSCGSGTNKGCWQVNNTTTPCGTASPLCKAVGTACGGAMGTCCSGTTCLSGKQICANNCSNYSGHSCTLATSRCVSGSIISGNTDCLNQDLNSVCCTVSGTTTTTNPCSTIIKDSYHPNGAYVSGKYCPANGGVLYTCNGSGGGSPTSPACSSGCKQNPVGVADGCQTSGPIIPPPPPPPPVNNPTAPVLNPITCTGTTATYNWTPGTNVTNYSAYYCDKTKAKNNTCIPDDASVDPSQYFMLINGGNYSSSTTQVTKTGLIAGDTYEGLVVGYNGTYSNTVGHSNRVAFTCPAPVCTPSTGACTATPNYCDGRGTAIQTCGLTKKTVPCTVTPAPKCETGNTCNLTTKVCDPNPIAKPTAPTINATAACVSATSDTLSWTKGANTIATRLYYCDKTQAAAHSPAVSCTRDQDISKDNSRAGWYLLAGAADVSSPQPLTGLVSGHSYTWFVRAFNDTNHADGKGNGFADSANGNFTAGACSVAKPTAPTINATAACVSATSDTLSWTINAANTTQTLLSYCDKTIAAKYNVSCTKGKVPTGETVGSEAYNAKAGWYLLPNNTAASFPTPQTLTGLVSGHSYTWYVIAFNGDHTKTGTPSTDSTTDGNFTAGACIIVVPTPNAPTALQTPTNCPVTANASVRLSWTKGANNISTAAFICDKTLHTGANDCAIPITASTGLYTQLNGTTSPVNATSLVAGHVYAWFVRGYTGSGTSLKFTNSVVGTSFTAPTAAACTTPTPDVPTCVQSTIAPTTGAAPLTVTLFGGGAAGRTSLVTGYEWDFDNNGSWDTGISIDPVKHTYGTPGTYTPKYRIKGSNNTWSATCDYKYKVVALNPGSASLNLVIGLDEIGTTGDNANPAWAPGTNTATINGVAVVNTFGGSNQNPKTQTPILKLALIDSSGKLVATPSVSLSYVNSSTSANFGKFIGTIDLGSSFKTGDYIAKVTVDGHLTRTITGIQTITAGHEKTLSARLVAGDIDNSNYLNVAEMKNGLSTGDYNILLSCISAKHPTTVKATDGKLCAKNANYTKRSDLNDDGDTTLIDDMNMFKREISVQNGD